VGVAALRRVAEACPDVSVAFYGMAQYEDLGFPYENLGELSREEVANAMNTSHIHLSFSLTNISWVPFEAMACGCAVVEAKVPSVELGLDEATEACLLVDPTPEAVADGVIRLVEDSGLRQRLASNGERYIDTIATTWGETCKAFEGILLESVFRTARS
jgi:glycosyltransferase involved in cell wall biosynthesis